jgi:enamine deaminase RidA (YjgF/YER057c/UK114 family)
VETILTIERHETTSLMSQAVVHNGVAYLSGQVAMNLPGAPVAEQARAIFARIDSLLDRVGSDQSRLLSAQIWLRKASDFAEMNAAWVAWLGASGVPARATVCGVELAVPGLEIEIAVIAAL